MVWILNSREPLSHLSFRILHRNHPNNTVCVSVCAQYTYRLIGWFRLYKSGACMFGLRIKRTWVILYKLHWQPFYLHTLFVSKMIVKWFIWCCVHTVCGCVYVCCLRTGSTKIYVHMVGMFDVCQTLKSNTCVDFCLYIFGCKIYHRA